jgi:hypothetical protein
MYHVALRTKKYKRRRHLRHNADTDAESNLGTMQDITHHVSTISYVTPLVAVFSGWIVLNESISLRAGSGVVAIFVGLATIECDGLMAILRRSSRWPLPKLPESKVQTESRA